MIRKRMLQILFPFFLLVACGSVDAGDVIDIAEAVGPPIMTEYVKSLTPTPTFGVANPIRDFFVFASSPSCEPTFEKTSDYDPFRSIICHDNAITVRYDEWITKAPMDEAIAKILADRKEVISEGTWDDGNPDEPLGDFYQFTDSEGRANIIWTVTISPFNNVSGWAQRTDGDHDALKIWWSVAGAKHY